MWVSHMYLLLLWRLWLHRGHHSLQGEKGVLGKPSALRQQPGHSWGCGRFSKVLQSCSSLSLSPSSLSGLARNHEAVGVHCVALHCSVCKC